MFLSRASLHVTPFLRSSCEAEEPEVREEILEAETKPSDGEKVKVEVNEEADPKDNFSLARNTSKTAVNKRYVVASAGKKALFQSALVATR